jgi:hypothetical protein
MFNLLRKIVISLILVLGIIYGYRYLTGKNITNLPWEIVNKLQEKGPTQSTNPKYYKYPEEQLPKN